MLRPTVTISLLVLLTALGGFPPPAASGQASTPVAACPATSEAENEALVRRWHEEVINGADLEGIDEIVAADVVHHAGTFPDGEGPEAVKAVLGALLAGFPGVQHTIEAIVADGDLVVTRWTATGAHDGEFQGFPPSGATVTWTGMNMFRIECGLIAEEWSELDGVGRAAQIEAVATPSP